MQSATLAVYDFAPTTNVAVRHLTVENTGGGVESHAIFTWNAEASIVFDHVTATATGASKYNVAVMMSSQVPELNNATLSNMTIKAAGGQEARGIESRTRLTAPVYSNLVVSATGGSVISEGLVVPSNSYVLVRDSSIGGANTSVRSSIDASVRIVDSVLAGPTLNLGPADCVDTVKPDLTPFTCI